MLYARAISLARTWRYKPFQRKGKMMPATFTEYISILPPELPVRTDAPFPAVSNWTSMKITLERTTCYGGCAAYRVEINGNGDVDFNQSYPVQQKRRGRISRQRLEGLLDEFRRANYFALDRYYINADVSDYPTYTTSISIDGQFMSVQDYAGLKMGMPVSVRDVQNAIDAAVTGASLK